MPGCVSQGSTRGEALTSIRDAIHHIADSRLVPFNHCGHWPPFEKPDEYAAQVLAFLKG